MRVLLETVTSSTMFIPATMAFRILPDIYPSFLPDECEVTVEICNDCCMQCWHNLKTCALLIHEIEFLIPFLHYKFKLTTLSFETDVLLEALRRLLASLCQYQIYLQVPGWPLTHSSTLLWGIGLKIIEARFAAFILSVQCLFLAIKQILAICIDVQSELSYLKFWAYFNIASFYYGCVALLDTCDICLD